MILRYQPEPFRFDWAGDYKPIAEKLASIISVEIAVLSVAIAFCVIMITTSVIS